MTQGNAFSRRTFLKGASAAAAVGPLAASTETQRPPRRGGETFGPGLHDLELTVNGERRRIRVEPRTTLLDALRDRLDLTGAKKICDRGACGGCTVLVDDQAVNSCMTLALDAAGAEVTTVEGLSSPSALDPGRLDELHPLQQEFVRCDALQCGYCTPGMVMAALACLRKHPAPTAAQIRHEMTGNLCRCGTYGRVFEAVERTAQRLGQGGRER